MTARISKVLAGRYEVLELIGRGGMAEVYLGRDKRLSRTVAIKLLRSDIAEDPTFQARFRREAQSAAALNHPAIVGVYDFGEEVVTRADGSTQTVPYIVMEYVPGRTLKERIKEEGALPVAQALRIARQIAGALAQAHANNLVHCDIKPHNILVMPDGNIKVADFGIARAVTESTMTYNDNIMGSVHYFSPEQARGTIITPKSDVYSLGVVLYEMLTGRIPFDGNTAVSIARKHLEEEPQPIRSIVPNIPPVVEALVTRHHTHGADEARRYGCDAHIRSRCYACAFPCGGAGDRRNHRNGGRSGGGGGKILLSYEEIQVGACPYPDAWLLYGVLLEFWQVLELGGDHGA